MPQRKDIYVHCRAYFRKLISSAIAFLTFPLEICCSNFNSTLLYFCKSNKSGSDWCWSFPSYVLPNFWITWRYSYALFLKSNVMPFIKPGFDFVNRLYFGCSKYARHRYITVKINLKCPLHWIFIKFTIIGVL